MICAPKDHVTGLVRGSSAEFAEMTDRAPITFITGNKGKLLEVTNILNSLGDNFNVTNRNIDLKV
jgi:hypothetical protein